MQLMNNAIKSRGDEEGVFADENVTLGHAGHPIQDLTRAGKQPMTYVHKDRSAVLIFDGRVHNFLEIRDELTRKGYGFRSRTDAEVMLASYLEWGYDCVDRFNGMWAFVIYDAGRGVFFCSRDRVGRKTLYYYFDGHRFVSSSQLKAILAHKSLALNRRENISRDAVNLYFGLGYVPSPLTIYQGTCKLEPRQNLVLDLRSKSITKWYYYRLPRYEPINDRKKLIEEGRKLIESAVRLRIIADVPTGGLLSAGLDSSTMVALMRKITDTGDVHTFSIGFEGKYDETPSINIIKDYLSTTHHQESFTERDFEQLVDAYATAFDEPNGDYSLFPRLKLCRMAREHVAVALSGDGGDEIFGGYPEYVMGQRMDLVRKMPRFLRALLSRIPARRNLDSYSSLFLLKNAFRLSLYDPALFYAKALETEIVQPEVCVRWTAEKLRLCLQDGVGMAEGLRLYDVLFNTLGDSALFMLDRASMSSGLEVWSPFLDYRLFEFSQKIPTKWKVDLFGTKKLMRDIVRNILPSEIVSRRKQGFTAPIQDWILRDHKILGGDEFLRSSAEFLRDLSPELYQFFIRRVLRENNPLYNRYRIRLFLFAKWMDRWIASASL